MQWCLIILEININIVKMKRQKVNLIRASLPTSASITNSTIGYKLLRV